MRKSVTTFLVAAAFAAATAWGHGDEKPRHGGLVQMAGEVKIELVAKGDRAEVYLDDHGEAIPTAKVSGKLTVLGAAGKTEAKLEPEGNEKLVAQGVKLAKGDKVIALVTMADKSTSSARFVIK